MAKKKQKEEAPPVLGPVLNRPMRFLIPLGAQSFFIDVRHPNMTEYQKFMASISPIVGGERQDNMVQATVEFCDTLMVGVEGAFYEDEKGNEQPLTIDVKNWKSYIPEWIKKDLGSYFATIRVQVLHNAKKNSKGTSPKP